MHWIKKGLIFTPDHHFDWMATHASVPVVDRINDSVLRIYFGTRDNDGRSHTSYLEVEANHPERILYLHNQPVLELGKPGMFDDRGIMPSWLVNHGNKKHLYYIGWSSGSDVPYHLAIGLAISNDEGRTFHKISDSPICDRSSEEPFFNTAPCVMLEGQQWRMWYVSCTGWERINDQLEPRYHVKYAESADGIAWMKTGRVCIDCDERTEAIGRPCVFQDAGRYRMIYSYRGMRGYRSDRIQSYRLGYAESDDGLFWTRKDDEVGIERSASGWDSEMMEYCFIHQQPGGDYLFYNGNGFGKTGVGYAVREYSDGS